MKNFLFALLLTLPVISEAASYYVGKSGSDANSCATAISSSAGNRKLTITSGLTCLSPGDTLLIGDGSYAQAFTSLPNGSSGQYITIGAENDGEVIVTGDLDLSHTNHYIIFQGLRFQSQNKLILGNHLKFFRNEFKGGCSSGNCVNTQVGTNNYSDTADILFEDNWFHGYPGGRYVLLIYNSSRIVVRRAVTRFDGFTDTGIPAANFSTYDSNGIEIQNSIAIDGITGNGLMGGYVAAYYNNCNNTGGVGCTNFKFRGDISINSSNWAMGTDGQSELTGMEVYDFASIGGLYGISSARPDNPTYKRLTILGVTAGDGIGAWGSTATISDSIFANNSGKSCEGLSATTSVAYNNAGGNTCGTVLNPFTNGLLYLPRIEAGSILASGGSGGGQRGANITAKIGTSGTLHGETGYNTTTGDALWPFPNETRIKKEMCTDVGVTRGFCGSSSLTQYVMNYLGNGNPYNVTSYTVTPSAGANGTISPNTAQTVNSGSTTAFTVTPSGGYTALVGGTCGGNLAGTTYTTNAVTANCTVTATFADTTAPTTPTDLDARSNSTSTVDLSWQPSTDAVGVTSYRVDYCSGFNCSSWATLGTSATNSYTHTGITPAANPTIYRYRVYALDAANNLSGAATSIYFNAVPTIPAFPGAEGGGATSKGGRGGTVYHVTSLDGGTGAGTLRACAVVATGPRTCVFDVAGNIELSSHINVSSPYLTIAGETAPGGGITVSGKNSTAVSFTARTHNIIVRGIRFRKGYNAGTPSQDGDSANVAGVSATSGPIGPIIFDHISASWGQDENVEVWSDVARAPKNVTYQWSMIYEPLFAHPVNLLTGASSSAVADNMTDIDLHHSILANSSHRNPMIKTRSFRVVNSLVYNWSDWALAVHGTGQVDIIGNKFKTGPLYLTESAKAYEIEATPIGNSTTATTGTTSLYVSGNVGPHNSDPLADNWVMTRLIDLELNGSAELGPLSESYRRLTPLPALPFPITAQDVASAETAVLAGAGASRRLDCAGNWISNRDSADARIVAEYTAGNVGIVPINEDAVGGYPTLAAGTACTDVDGDGMPDIWETANGLNPASAADGPILHASGYSNLERYLAGSTRTVTPSAGPNGSISPNTAQTVSSGNTAIFTVTPSAGYVAIVGGTCGGNLVGTTYTTSAITADCTVAATFPCKKLATPSGLSFVGLVANPPSNATMSFDWSDVTTHADGSALTGDLANYRTYWGTVSGGPYNTSSAALSQISVGPTQANITYYARVAAESSINSICHSDQSSEISLFADTVPPVLSGLNPSGNYPKTAANVALGVTTNESAVCRYGSSGSSWASKTAFSTTGATSHSATLSVWAGLVKRICYQCRDALLNESAESCTTFSVSAKPKVGVFN